MMKNSNLIIFVSIDPDSGQWEPLAVDNVPDTIKDPEVLGNLVAGDMCKIGGDDLWYRAEKHHA